MDLRNSSLGWCLWKLPKSDCQTLFHRQLQFIGGFSVCGNDSPCFSFQWGLNRGATQLSSPKDTGDRAVFVKYEKISLENLIEFTN